MNLYCKMLMHVPCTRCVELPWGGVNSLPSDDFPFPWVGLVSSQSVVFSSSRTSKALQWSSAAWALKRERERERSITVSRSFFVQLIYSDKTPTLKSSIFLIVTLNASLSSPRFNCFYVSCFQGLPPVNRTCFVLLQLQLKALSDHRARLCCRFAGQKLGDVRPEAQPWTVKREVKTCLAFSGLKFNGLPWALQCLLTYLLTIPTVPAIVKCCFFLFFSVSQTRFSVYNRL